MATPAKGPTVPAAGWPRLHQRVESLYGGKGGLGKGREGLTDAEDRFDARLGSDIGEQLAAAWTETLAIEPQLDCVTCDPAKLQAVRAEDELLVPRFTLRGGALSSEERRVGKECDSTCSYRWSPYH